MNFKENVMKNKYQIEGKLEKKNGSIIIHFTKLMILLRRKDVKNKK